MSNTRATSHAVDDGIRKTVIFLSSLHPAKASLLLKRMGPEAASTIRRHLTMLGSVELHEKEETYRHFISSCKTDHPNDSSNRFRSESPTYGPPTHHHQQGRFHKRPFPIERFHEMGDTFENTSKTTVEETGKHLAGVDEGETLATCRSDVLGGDDLDNQQPQAHKPEEEPFGFLRDAEARNLAAVMSEERPQTIALVLAHLPPKQAGDVLVGFSPSMQTEIVRRLTHLEETDPDVLKEVGTALQSKLKHSFMTREKGRHGQQIVQEIFSQSDSRVKLQLMANLDDQNRKIVEQFSKERLHFDDLLTLDGKSFGKLIHSVDSRILILALVGASPLMIEQVIAAFPTSAHKGIRHQLNHLGPIQLNDVEESRRILVRQAIRLAAEGKIFLRSGGHSQKSRYTHEPHVEYAA